MSLFIEIEDVTQVLLADGWHVVVGKSFDTDAYEFATGDRMLVGGGHVAGVAATGATWLGKGGVRISCPLTSVLAVKTEDGKDA